MHERAQMSCTLRDNCHHNSQLAPQAVRGAAISFIHSYFPIFLRFTYLPEKLSIISGVVGFCENPPMNPLSPKLRLLGGSWVVKSMVISRLMWVIAIVILLISLLITTREPPSNQLKNRISEPQDANAKFPVGPLNPGTLNPKP